MASRGKTNSDKVYTHTHTISVADISATADSYIIPVKGDGLLVDVEATTDIDPAADETITVSVNGASQGTVVIATSGWVISDIDALSPTAPGIALSDGDYITIANDSGATGAATLTIVVYIAQD